MNASAKSVIVARHSSKASVKSRKRATQSKPQKHEMVIKDYGANTRVDSKKIANAKEEKSSAVFYGSVCPENRTQSRYSVSQLNRYGQTVDSAIGNKSSIIGKTTSAIKLKEGIETQSPSKLHIDLSQKKLRMYPSVEKFGEE